MNEVQEIFLVLFSILFGTMLQSLGGLMPFPWGKIFSRKKYVRQLKGKIVVKTIKKIVFWRLTLSIIILNILPLAFFIVVLYSLRGFCGSFYSSSNILALIYVGWSALAVFGFYRIYHFIIVHPRIRWIFWDRLKAVQKREISENWKAHLWSALLYLLPPIAISVSICICKDPIISPIFIGLLTAGLTLVLLARART